MDFVFLQILAAVCVGIAGYYITHHYKGRVDSENPIFYFILAMFACLLATFSLLIACFVSMADATMLNKTLFVSITIKLCSGKYKR